MTRTKKPVYSWSALNTFTLCAHSYYEQYIKGRRSKGNYYTLRGNGVHKARQFFCMEKLKSGVPLPLDDCTDAARDEIYKQVNEDKIDLKSEELIGLGKGGAANLILNDTRPLIKRDHDGLYPLVRPRYIEQQIPIELSEEDFDLFGILDMIDDRFRVCDVKVSGKKITQDYLDNDMQMTIYWLLAKTFLGRTVPSGYIDFIYSGKPVTAQRLPWTRNDGDVIKVIKRFRVMHNSIEAGNFPPASPGSWKCSPKWCSFFQECPYV